MRNFDVGPVEKNINYQFKNKSHLLEAMTHKSFCVDEYHNEKHFERLEFLGDAILNLAVADDLLENYPQDDEGLLSKKRASLVNQTTLQQMALNCQLEEFLILGPGERKQNSHLKPRMLASCFEAVIGAVYRDAGYPESRKFVLEQFAKLDFKVDDENGFELDYKTRLQEITQKYKMGTPTYELMMTKGPSHQPRFLVALKLSNEEKSRAEGSSKKRAEQLAAEMFLNNLKKENKT